VISIGLSPSTSAASLYFSLSVAHCNTLQHTATHCNTLQHTATHWLLSTSLYRDFEVLSIAISIGLSRSTGPLFCRRNLLNFSFLLYFISEIGSAHKRLSMLFSIGLSPSTTAAPYFYVDHLFYFLFLSFSYYFDLFAENISVRATSLDFDLHPSISQYNCGPLFLIWLIIISLISF